MGNVLVVYSLFEHPLRESVRDHLEAFRRYSPRRCFYLNLAVRRAPGWLRKVPFELVIFHTTLLSKRGATDYWQVMLERAAPLKGLGEVRVALPQDEYHPPGRLVDFIEEFEVDHVFSVAPESEWPAIYPGLSRDRVQLHRVLTGYLEPRAVARIEAVSRSSAGRAIDIGYRAKDLPAWLGRHARLKVDVADAFAEAAPRRGLSVDISTNSEDTLMGEDWLAFLLGCKYTIGVEGGASLFDRDGSVRAAVERYVAENPGASFEEIERACFAGQDGSFGLLALSPRHLEACATRTCQVLVDGDYSGVLQAGRHYIALRADFSNLDDVLETIRRDEERERIVTAAWDDLVASGAYTYERLVELVEAAALKDTEPLDRGSRDRLAQLRARVVEKLTWAEMFLRLRLGPVLLPLRRVLRRALRRRRPA